MKTPGCSLGEVTQSRCFFGVRFFCWHFSNLGGFVQMVFEFDIMPLDFTDIIVERFDPFDFERVPLLYLEI